MGNKRQRKNSTYPARNILPNSDFNQNQQYPYQFNNDDYQFDSDEQLSKLLDQSTSETISTYKISSSINGSYKNACSGRAILFKHAPGIGIDLIESLYSELVELRRGV